MGIDPAEFRAQILAELLEIARRAREASESGEVHHTWAKCLSEWRGALKDALAVNEPTEKAQQIEEMQRLERSLTQLRDELHGGRAGYMPPPDDE